MRSHSLIAFGFVAFAVAFMTPSVAGQATVDRCSQQCAPQDADVNTPPVRSEGPINVIFYAHWEDILNRAPLNTQPPDPRFERDLNQGFPNPTIIVDTPPPCPDCGLHFQYNVFNLFTLPARVEPSQTGFRAPYQQGDPAYDMRLADGPIIAYVYLSAYPVPTQNSGSGLGPSTNLGSMALLRIHANWYAGRTPDPTATLASGVSDSINLVYTPGGDPVYEVRIVMGRFVDFVPGGQGTVLTLRLDQVTTDRAVVLQSDWRLRSGPLFPWRLIVPVEEPLQSRSLTSFTNNNTFLVKWTVRSPLGAYDLDDATFLLHAAGPGGQALDLGAPATIERSSAFNGYLKSVHAYWRIPPDLLGAAKSWQLEASVANSQGTYVLTAETEGHVADYRGQTRTPGFEGAILLVALGALMAFVRRGRA